jgi:hypothetical protein
MESTGAPLRFPSDFSDTSPFPWLLPRVFPGRLPALPQGHAQQLDPSYHRREEAAVDQLSQQVGQRPSRVRSSRVPPMFLDPFSEPKTFVKLANQVQAGVRRDARTLELNSERGVERERKWTVSLLTPGGVILQDAFMAPKPA